jgi:hypothetical protein
MRHELLGYRFHERLNAFEEGLFQPVAMTWKLYGMYINV